LSDKIQGLVVFPSCWSVYGSRKVLLNKEVLILSGNLILLTSIYVGPSMVQEKSSSIRRSLS